MPTPPTETRPRARPQLTVFALAVSLFTFLIVIRALLVGLRPISFFTWYEIPRVLGSAYYDLLVQSAALALIAFVMLPRWPRLRRIAASTYAIWAIASLLIALVNYEAVGLLGVPVNYQWLYYSDFLTSFDAQQALGDTLSPALILTALGVVVAMLALAWLCRAALKAIEARGLRARWFYAAALVIASVYFPLTAPHLGASSTNKLLANPMYSFASSWLATGAPTLSTFASPAAPDDFLTVGERARVASTAPRAKIDNVLIFVMESVAAEYVDPYGSKFGATPTLRAYRDRSLLVRNAYANVPSTNKSLLSLLCGIYPWISFRSLTQDHPTADVTSISSVLAQRGFRTSLFFSSDLRHQNMDGFLARHDFDRVEDYRTRQAEAPLIRYELQRGETVTATDDATTARSFNRWIDAEPDKPFFSVLWTVATHHPYFPRGEGKDFGVKSRALNRYLNALEDGDAALGMVLEHLESRRLLDRTLVVVLGDHGEAFGRHGQIGHASNVWEENLRIPLMWIHPVFKGTEDAELASIIDIAPTVLDLLGAPAPATWQGRSLFAQDRVPRVYFFAPYSELLFGYREGDRKIVFNASSNRYRIHDLARDPLEETNLDVANAAEQIVADKRIAEERLASWIQYQNRFMKRLLQPSPR